MDELNIDTDNNLNMIPDKMESKAKKTTKVVDRKSVVQGKSVRRGVQLGGRHIMKQNSAS